MKTHLSILVALAGSAAFAGNLISNGGFEMGTAGWTARRNVAIEDVQKNIPDFQIDSSERKEGRNSLHLPPSPAKTTWSVNSGDFPVEPGKAYTASFWVKAEKPTKLLFGIYAVPDARWFVSTRVVTVPAGWSRHTVTKQMPKGVRCAFFRVQTLAEAPNCGLWFDSFSVVPGFEAMAYAPKQDVELLFLNQTERFAERGKPFTFTLRGGNIAAVPVVRSGELRLTELATGKTVAKVPWSLTIPANGTADAVLSVTVGKYGVYKLSGKELPYGFQFGCAAPQRPASKESRHRFELGTSALFPTNNEIPAVSSSSLYPLHNGALDAAFRVCARAGIRIYRLHDDGLYAWEKINPAEGVWHWEDMDALVDAAGKTGIQILPCIGRMSFLRISGAKHYSTNENWYLFKQAVPSKLDVFTHHGTKVEPMLLPQKVWIEFVRQHAVRYRGRIPYYEIMNEPNIMMKADEYAEYLKTAFRTIRENDPEAEVIGLSATGDRGGRPGDFVFDSRNAGAMEYCDAVSFHPYSAQLDCSLRNAHDLNRVIRSLSKRKDGRALPVWNTELYYIRPGAPVDSGVDPVEAKYVFRRFLIDLGDGIAKSVSLHASVIFSRSDLNHGQFTALFRREPIPNDIFIAHAAAGAMLNDAVPLKKHLYSKYVNSTAFRHADGWYGLGIWSVEPESKMLLTLPEAKAPVQVYDCFGNEIAAPEKLTDAPVVFRFNGDEAAFDEWRGGIRVAPFCPWKYHGARVMNKQLLMAFENISSEPLLLKVRPVLPGFSATSVTIPAASAKEVSVIASRNLPESFECVVFDGKKMTKVKVTPRKPKTAAFGEPLSIDGKASCTVTPEKEFLRIALNVKDSVRGKRNPKAIWLGDTVELFFDAEPGLVPDRRFYTPFCKRLFLARKSANGLEEKLEGMRMDASAVRWNIRERNDGYQAVLEIPWASLGTVPGAPLGFDACVNDYDDSGKLISRAFWAGNQDNHKDRTLFGILK